MPERGGTTTQSGILFQNSISALYLGRLLDPTPRKPSEHVVHVRPEAPSIVDDIVVTFADEHTEYIQAKESLSDADWAPVWRSFVAQYRHSSFRRGKDRLVLICGHEPPKVIQTAEASARAFSSPEFAEWMSRLSERGRSVVQDIADAIGFSVDSELHALLQHVTIEVISLRSIERDRTFFWIPQSSMTVMELFRHLRDRVGAHARTRITVDRESLLRELTDEIPSFRLSTEVAFADIERSIKRCNALLRQHKVTLGNTGIHCERAVVRTIVEWMVSDEAAGRAAMLLDHAGAGKTVVVADVANQLESNGCQVLALKTDLQLSDISSVDELQSRLQLPDTFERVVERLSANGPVFVLFDQIDALSLALAHNEQTLAVLLDVVARVASIPGVRLLLSCRSFDRNNDPRLRVFKSARDFSIPPFDDEELRQILSAIGADPIEIPRPTRELIRVPLHMDLFLLTRAGGSAPATLQDLYRSLIHQVALQAAPGAPSRAARHSLLTKLTAYMHDRHRTNVPDKFLGDEDHAAIEWLASHGILERTEDGWTFRHQTMLEYLFADDFVEHGRSLHDRLANSAQGLPLRTELLQILPHLRAERPAEFVAEIAAICASEAIRFHLRDLALRWFAALRSPSRDETAWVSTVLDSPNVRWRFWLGARGNAVWLDELREHVEDALLHEDAFAAEDVLAYIGSVAQERQTGTVELLTRLALARETSAMAIASILSRVEWSEPRVIDLFALLAERGIPLLNKRSSAAVIRLDPVRSVRWIAAVARRLLVVQMHADAITEGAFVPEPAEGLAAALAAVKSGAAQEWLKVMVPSFDELVAGSVLDHPSEPGSFPRKGTDTWQLRVVKAMSLRSFEYAPRLKLIVGSIVGALSFLKTPEEIHAWVDAIGRSRSRLLQDALASTLAVTVSRSDRLAKSGSQITKLAIGLIESRHRRIGGESAGLHALVEHLMARRQLPARVLDRLRREIQSQADLTDQVRAEWENVWNRDAFTTEAPVIAEYRAIAPIYVGTSPFGDVASELIETYDVHEIDESSSARARNVDSDKPMSRREWRLALQRTDADGNIDRTATKLRTAVAGDAEWFVKTFAKARHPIAAVFVRELFRGLEQTSIPIAEVRPIFSKHVASPVAPGVPAAVAWWLARRSEPIPGDLLDQLETWARDPKLEGSGPTTRSYHYLGSDRGAPLLVLLRALRTHGGPERASLREDLFEYVAREGTCVLKAAAIDELIYELPANAKKTFDWLDRFFIHDDKELLHAARLVPLLQAALRHSFSRVSRYIVDLYDSSDDKELRARGAQLLAQAALASGSSNSPDLLVARRLFESSLETASAEHNCAAIRVLVAALDRSPAGDYAIATLQRLVGDPDPAIHAEIAQSFFHLGRWDLAHRQPFFFAYAQSRALVTSIETFATMLLDHGLPLPEVSLSLIEAMLANQHLRAAPRVYHGKELIQFVIRIELFPASSTAQRRRAMNVFDVLMERYADMAGDVLADWDRQ